MTAPVKRNPRQCLAPFYLCRFLIVLLFLTTTVRGQISAPLQGAVTSHDGQPLAGVWVYGGQSPALLQRQQTKTDENGHFFLRYPGAVVHFSKEKFQPSSLILTPGTSNVYVTLEAATGDLVVRACGKPGPHLKRIGGRFGIYFDVPTNVAKLTGGGPGVDAIAYNIKPKKGSGELTLVFGQFPINRDPADEMFLNSVQFQQRNVVDANGEVIGLDSFGKLASGELWRHTYILAQGGLYQSPAAATPLFDMVLNSACQIPITVQ
ncbi:MAG: carboxypeptidase-like regulatory domain-containing protein [Candidatus Acidiferrum sp.]|jgi:hypothetical protein